MSTQGDIQDDILIIGGGPVGATLALALAGSGLSVTVLEARTKGDIPDDERALALSYGSRLILQRLGVWQQLDVRATAITTIHVSQKERWGRAMIEARESGQPALGYVLPYSVLSSVLAQAMDAAPGIEVLHGAQVSGVATTQTHGSAQFDLAGQPASRAAALLALADGGRLLESIAGMQRHIRDYGQSAVIAHVESELAHGHVAYERFTPDGPVALLPDGERGFALVWTAAPERAQTLCGLPAPEFLEQLGRHFGERVGRFTAVAGRAVFPLKLSRTSPLTSQRLVAIGNAAQTLHPVAGQGFNLGLRDAWTLAQLARNTPRERIGEQAMLAQYSRLRRADRAGGIGFTDFLATAFATDFPGLASIRGLGIGALDLMAPAKSFLSRKMSFGARG